MRSRPKPKHFAYYKNRGEFCMKPGEPTYSVHASRLYRIKSGHQVCLGWLSAIPFSTEPDPLVKWTNERINDFFEGIKDRSDAVTDSEIAKDTVKFIMGAMKDPFKFDTNFKNRFNELLKICALLLGVTSKSIEEMPNDQVPDLEYSKILAKAPTFLDATLSFFISILPELIEHYPELKEMLDNTADSNEVYRRTREVCD